MPGGDGGFLEDLERQLDIESTEVELILADYHLDNDENGVDVVGEINRRRSTPAPVLMITANYSNELKQRIRTLGYLLMNKPLKPLKLRSVVHHVVHN